MKLNRSYQFIAITSTALLTVLIIQVSWIFQAANVKKELFNEKANMVLARTTEALRADKITSLKIAACIGKDSSTGPYAKIGRSEARMIDSLLTYYMRSYNLYIDYSFSVIKPHLSIIENENANSFRSSFSPPQAGCYVNNLQEEASRNGIDLKLTFPEKEQFIREEMSTPFITSVILIIIVLVMSWRTVMSLMKEKRISEHTTDFLNNMTHEFKTPLTNIALAGKMILKDPGIQQEEKIKHYSEIILEENEKLRLQVEQVLSMTALERGEIPLRKTEVDFHELISTALKCMSLQIESKQGNFKLKTDAERFVIMGDKTHLTNALCNLIDNAIKYSAEKPEIFIQTYNAGYNLIIVISDKGIGIEKEYQKNVFDKFFRVPTGDVHDVKGFGLGLAYVKKIIELHGGTIELQSEKGKGMSAEAFQAGTTFTITLPNA
ncbi:MAG: hypothetical protein JWO44_2335 [Bacteroidetes bacterium]|nr:hypothetical protein [Bacteroidota bacterium]